MSEWTIEKIIKELEEFNGHYKREAVDAAINRKEEITPYLIKILENVLENPEEYADKPDYWGHTYAVMLLAHFKEEKAHQLILDLFALSNDLPHKLFGDMKTEDLPMLLYRTCGGSLEKIKSFIANKDVYLYCRTAACNALNYAVVNGIASRKEVIDFYGSLFTGKEAEEDSLFWGLVTASICDLHPKELAPIIKKAFDDELIDENAPFPALFYEDVESDLKKSIEEVYEELRKKFESRSMDDFHKTMVWWACFEENKGETEEQKKATDILLSLLVLGYGYNREKLDFIIENREKIMPLLLIILETIAKRPDRFIENLTNSLHIYALLLSGHFKEEKAHKLIVDMVSSLNSEQAWILFNDIMTEELPMVLYNTCGGSLEHIKALALNKKAYTHSRTAAMTALNYAVINGRVPREEILNFYDALLTDTIANKDPEEEPEFWSWIISEAQELYPQEILPTIKKAFEGASDDDIVIDYDEIEQTIQAGMEDRLKETRQWFERSSLENIHERIQKWVDVEEDYDYDEEDGKENLLDFLQKNKREPEGKASYTPPPKTAHQAKAKKKKAKNKMAKKTRKQNKKKKKR